MTYREMLMRDHPTKCGNHFLGGCQACPGDFYPGGPVEDELGCFSDDTEEECNCQRCWNQEAKGTT